jgi:type IV secretion system protein VirD4
MAQTATPAEPMKDTALVGLAVGALTVGTLWAAGVISARISGHRPPRRHPLGELAAFAHIGDPSAGWHEPVGPPAVYWSITAVMLALLAALAVASWRVFRSNPHDADDPKKFDGLAERREVKAAAGAKALLAHAAILRPSVSKPSPSDVGVRIGASRGMGCWASVEDSMVLLGPPRSGKGLNIVIPSILDYPGAVITTSTRADNLSATMTARARLGPVAVFDPQGLADGVPSVLRWSPVRGCERAQTAMIRAAALTATAGESVTEGSFWKQQTQTAVRCLLHAAAVGEKPPSSLYKWSMSAPAAKEAVRLLIDSPGAIGQWDQALDAIISADQRQRDSVWAMVANAFAALADPGVLEAVSPGLDEAFDPARFLKSQGTLYLLGTAAGASATAGLVSALVEDVVEVARRLAAGSPGARLDPPLGLILDEAANYPLPSLGALMSEGGGSGLTTVAVLQSLAQARDRWGREVAQAIWDSAICKVILPGGSNADDLADLSRLLGERTVREQSKSWSAGGGRSVSTSERKQAILDPAMIRTLRPGHALLLLRAARPIMLTLRPWTARRDAATIRTERKQIERIIREVAAAEWSVHA